MSFVYMLALAVFFMMCLILCVVIMMQEGKSGGGLGASFGGGDSGESLFGSSTPDILKRFTAWMVFAFMVSCVVLSLWTSAFERTRGRQAPNFTIEDIQGE